MISLLFTVNKEGLVLGQGLSNYTWEIYQPYRKGVVDKCIMKTGDQQFFRPPSAERVPGSRLSGSNEGPLYSAHQAARHHRGPH